LIKTFRGLLPSDGVDPIVLHTNNGSTGYRIVKLKLFPVDADAGYETVIKVYSTSSNANVTTPTITADFGDNELLAAGWYERTGNQTGEINIVFDNMVFNQDIYVTCKCGQGASMNYYLELEQIKLDLNESTVATLKDIRNTK
jgi:hypothetical protein